MKGKDCISGDGEERIKVIDMYACKVVVTTLDVILMLILLDQCIRKSQDVIIGLCGICGLLAVNGSGRN